MLCGAVSVCSGGMGWDEIDLTGISLVSFFFLFFHSLSSSLSFLFSLFFLDFHIPENLSEDEYV